MRTSVASDLLIDLIEAIGYEVTNSAMRKRLFIRVIPLWEEAGCDEVKDCCKYDDDFAAAFKELHPEDYDIGVE